MINGLTPRFKPKGIISLGVKRLGIKHPDNMPHFVLTKAPAVAMIYGPEPKSLDIVFPTRDMERVVPHAYKFWSGGRMNEEGNIIDGVLKCIGNGSYTDETGVEIAGTADWRDKNNLPPKDEILTERDRRTGMVKRMCWGRNCVDYGNCKQNMTMYFTIPRVHPTDIYEMHTSSWSSINSVINLVNQVLMAKDDLVDTVFRIFKKPVPNSFWDREKQKEVKGVKDKVFMEEWDTEKFMIEHGAQVIQARINAKKTSGQFLAAHHGPALAALAAASLPSREAAMLNRSAEQYPVEPPAIEVLAKDSSSGVNVESLIDDPDLQLAFDEYARVIGSPLSAKDRLILIKKKEGAPDLKLEVLRTLRRRTEERRSQLQPPPEIEVTADIGGIT